MERVGVYSTASASWGQRRLTLTNLKGLDYCILSLYGLMISNECSISWDQNWVLYHPLFFHPKRLNGFYPTCSETWQIIMDGQWSTSQHPRCICLTIGVQISSHGHLWSRIHFNCKTNHLWHCPGGATTAGPNPSAKTIKTSLQNYIAMLRYPRIQHEPTSSWYHWYHGIVLLASPLVNCHAGVNEFNTHIFSSPQHVTSVLIMWSCAENYGIPRKALV